MLSPLRLDRELLVGRSPYEIQQPSENFDQAWPGTDNGLFAIECLKSDQRVRFLPLAVIDDEGVRGVQ